MLKGIRAAIKMQRELAAKELAAKMAEKVNICKRKSGYRTCRECEDYHVCPIQKFEVKA